MNKKIRVLLADDHPLVRTGLRMTLALEKRIALVGEATTGTEVKQLCRENQPDIVLLDLNMPDSSPNETIAYLQAHYPTVKVLILTAYDDDAYVRDLSAAGIAGYLLKDEATETVVQAIYAVAQDRTWFSQAITGKMVRLKTEAPILTEREQQILALIAQGLQNTQIADELGLADQTVRNYVSRIYTSLEVKTRAEAVIWARERGLS